MVIHCPVGSVSYLIGKLKLGNATYSCYSENLQSELPAILRCLVFTSLDIYSLHGNSCVLSMFSFLQKSFKSLFSLHDLQGEFSE